MAKFLKVSVELSIVVIYYLEKLKSIVHQFFIGITDSSIITITNLTNYCTSNLKHDGECGEMLWLEIACMFSSYSLS